MRLLSGWLTACVVFAAVISTQSALADEYQSIAVGGVGGAPYTLRCAQGDYLVGLQARYGNWVDAIAPQCARWNNGNFLPPGIGPLQGGTGGQIGEFHCDEHSVITSLTMEVADNQWGTVAMIVPRCGDALHPDHGTRGAGIEEFGTSFVERQQNDDPNVGTSAVVDYDYSKMPHCNAGDVAVGIYGGAGNYVDRVGLICAPAPQMIIALPTAPLPPIHHGPVVTQPAGSVVLAPARCLSGFVWREASPTDYVCVTPESRERVRQENAVAQTRTDPNGAWGPASCINGFVWREAFDGDKVCVTPEIRDVVRQENATAPSRTH